MIRVRARIMLADNRIGIGSSGASPLHFAYVRHLPFGPTYITDERGYLFDEQGDEGITSLTRHADISVYCQNSIVRMLNGALQPTPSIRLRIVNSAGGSRPTYTLSSSDTTATTLRQFRLLNQFAEVYQAVWRQFEPFRSAGDFPLGRRRTLEQTRNQPERIEVVHPSPSTVTLQVFSLLATHLGVDGPPPDVRIYSFVDPVGSTTRPWPRIFLESQPPETRLFGTPSDTYPNGNRKGLQLVPAELAHALHFSQLTAQARRRIRESYLGFILTDLANGGSGTHRIGLATTPLVAFLEALDHLSHRFLEHTRHTRTSLQPLTDAQRAAYVNAEIDGSLTANFPGLTRVAQPVTIPTFARELPARPSPSDLTPSVTTADLDVALLSRVGADPSSAVQLHGNTDEGAILGAIFIDLARRTNLRFAVETVLASRATTFGAYRQWFNSQHPTRRDVLDDVALRWGL